VIVSTLALHLKVAESYPVTSQCMYEHSRVEVHKNTDYENGKRMDFIQNLRRSRLKNFDELKIFIKEKVRNHLPHQFYAILVKI